MSAQLNVVTPLATETSAAPAATAVSSGSAFPSAVGLPPAAAITAPPRSLLRRVFRQDPWARVSTALIGIGAFMLMQPFSLDVFSYSFIVLLAGVIGLSVAAQLPK
jgi:hypothetical protein